MRQDTLSIDFRYSYKNGASDVFHYNVECSLKVASEITLQNAVVNEQVLNAVPAYYIPALRRLVIADSSMYWEVNGNVLSAKNEYSGASITDMFADSSTGEQHRMVFGGRNLGTNVTSAQISAVRDGSFKGLLVGDYWNISDRIWRIVDMDYWYGCGDTPFNQHHLVIMPDAILINAPMNDTNTTVGGYVGSKMRMETLPEIKLTCERAFPDMILTHRDFLVSVVNNGYPTTTVWTDSDVELASEIMMYGSRIVSQGNNGAAANGLYTINRSQMALFSLVPRFIKQTAGWSWLRDPVNATSFAHIYNSGFASSFNASTGHGVRPVFPIG